MSEHDVVINYLSSLDNVVPASTREDAINIVRPLKCAWTKHAKRCTLVGPRSHERGSKWKRSTSRFSGDVP